MKRKYLLMMMFLLAMVGRASATVGFEVSAVSVNAGASVQVPVTLPNMASYSAFEFVLLLPEGITLDKAKFNNNCTGEDNDDNPLHKMTRSAVQREGFSSAYKLACYSDASALFLDVDEPIVTITLKADRTATGSLQAKIAEVVLTDDLGNKPDCHDTNINITVQGLPTVTADNKSREYGDANPELTYTVTGGSISGTLTLTTTAEATSPVGDYTITVPTSDNYNAVNGTLTVTKAPLIINGGTYSIKQGEALPTLAPVYTGFKNNETSAVLTSQPVLTLQEGVTSASAPGNYTITVTDGAADNYEITRTDGTLTITAADPVKVTAKSYTITYGDAIPTTFEYESEGADLTGVPEITCSATATSGVGTYPITISQGSITNYNVTYVDGTLTINKAPLTITAENKSKTYGDANPEFTCTYVGFVKEETNAVLSPQPTLATEATVASGVGTYDITVTGAAAANYEITQTKGTLTVTKATLTATAKSVSVKQGEPTPELEIEYSGWKNGDDVSSLTTAPTASTTREVSSEPGSYPITVTGGVADNYEFNCVAGTLTVTAADLITVTVTSAERFYGDENPTFEYTVAGGTLTGVPVLSCIATKTSAPGEYDITIEKGTISNYNVSLVAGKLTVKKAPLTAKAKDLTVEQGVATPTLEIEYTGFKNNETEDVIDTKPTASTTREVSSPAGEYPITVTGGEDTNYAITTQNGTLTVTLPGLITVTVTDAERYYGSENPTFQYTVTGGTLNGEPALSCTATKTSVPGEYDITIEKGTIANYNVSLVPGKLTVKKAPLTITAENKEKTYGEDNPTFTYTCSGLVNDETEAVITTEPTLSTTATADSNVGTYDINASGAVAANYEISYVKGTLTVNPKSITLSISLTPNPATYTYDESEKQPTVSVTATGISSLTAGTDYTLSGTLSATNAGDYTITATPAGNYTGSAASANWTITPRTSTDSDGNGIVEDGVDVTLTSVPADAVADDGGLTIPNDITKIDDNAFDNVDKDDVEYVDLTNTSVSGVNVDRDNGVFNGFPENTLICVPTGNTAAADEPNVVIGTSCQELKLSDNAPTVLPIDFNASKVTYARTLTASRASTVCLPYSLTSDATISYYELASSTADALVFSEVTTTDANKPYLAIPKTAGASFGKSISTAISNNKNFNGAAKSITGYKMVGTMTIIGRTCAEDKYILQSDNKWHEVTSASPADVTIPAYHAYVEGTTGAARLNTMIEDATGIETIITIDADGTERWYDMNGRRLQGKPTIKGAYINNGKKYITK